MFGIDSGELLLIAIVALVVIGPKDLPRVMRSIGNFIGQARGMARHFRSGVDAMIRDSELADMEKKWQADNERIMREHPPLPSPAAYPGQGGGPDTGYVTEETAYKGGAYGGEAWPEPTEALPPPSPRPAAARPRGDRPKPPPRRTRAGLPGGTAPPLPAKAPPVSLGKDEGG